MAKLKFATRSITSRMSSASAEAPAVASLANLSLGSLEKSSSGNGPPSTTRSEYARRANNERVAGALGVDQEEVLIALMFDDFMATGMKSLDYDRVVRNAITIQSDKDVCAVLNATPIPVKECSIPPDEWITDMCFAFTSTEALLTNRYPSHEISPPALTMLVDRGTAKRIRARASRSPSRRRVAKSPLPQFLQPDGEQQQQQRQQRHGGGHEPRRTAKERPPRPAKELPQGTPLKSSRNKSPAKLTTARGTTPSTLSAAAVTATARSVTSTARSPKTAAAAAVLQKETAKPTGSKSKLKSQREMKPPNPPVAMTNNTEPVAIS